MPTSNRGLRLLCVLSCLPADRPQRNTVADPQHLGLCSPAWPHISPLHGRRYTIHVHEHIPKHSLTCTQHIPFPTTRFALALSPVSLRPVLTTYRTDGKRATRHATCNNTSPVRPAQLVCPTQAPKAHARHWVWHWQVVSGDGYVCGAAIST